MNARDYQSECHEALRSAFRSGKKRVLCELATGSGKTVIFSMMANMAKEKGHKTLILCNRDNLIQQAAEKYYRVTKDHPSIEKSIERGSRHSSVVVASIQTLQGDRLKGWDKNHFGLVITDECFVSGTNISIPHGTCPIDNLNVGDYVIAFDHLNNTPVKKRVIKFFKKRISTVLELRLENGVIIVCTPDHPFFCNGNYIPAKDLTCGSAVHNIAPYGKQSKTHKERDRMQTLWSGCDMQQRKCGLLYELGRIPSRFSVLFKRMQGFGLWQLNKEANEGEESNEAGISAGETKDITSCEGMETNNPGRERKTASNTSDHDGGGFGVENRTNGYNKQEKKFRLSSALQTRYRQSNTKNRSGNRWKIAQSYFEKTTGSQKRESLERVRVESVTIHKQGGQGEFARLCPSGFVYNLEIEDCNNYFAEGILVHNCHGAAARSFRNVLNHFGDAWHAGFSATIERSDNQGIGWFYEDIVYRKSILDLVDEGWLVPIEFQKIPVPVTLDETIATAKNITEQQEEFALEPYVERLVYELGTLISPHKSLVFFPECKPSQAAAQMLRDRGLDAKHVDSTYMPDHQRRGILDWFKRVEIGCLTNASLLTTGYDQPDISAVAILRLIKSRQLFTQIVGRGTRPTAFVDNYPDKEARKEAIAKSAKPKCTIFDILIQSDNHNIAQPSCLISDLKDEQKAIEKITAKYNQGPIDLDKLKAAVDDFRIEETHNKLKKVAELAATAARKESRKYNGPFVGDILRVDDGGKIASSKQIWLLKKFGAKYDFDELTTKQASRCISRWIKHNERKKQHA